MPPTLETETDEDDPFVLMRKQTGATGLIQREIQVSSQNTNSLEGTSVSKNSSVINLV